MSMDAGGLAQMTYNNFQPNGGIGMPGAGFASRGKGAQLKRLSVASPPKVASISENSVETPTPRTSRSHLLAGLRTAPKTPTSAQPPASAPFNQGQHSVGGMEPGRFGRQSLNGINHGVPQTAIGSGFSGSVHSQFNQQQMLYADQVLAPPSLQFDENELDPNIAAQLLATEIYLAQRQQQLQQQLLNLTAQQFGGMNLNSSGQRQSQPFPSTPFTPQTNAYNQQFQPTSAPQETGQPGVYLTFNPMTGQYNYVLDNAYQQNQQQGNNIREQTVTSNLANSPPPPTPSFTASPPTKANTPTLQVSPPNEINPSPWGSRSSSPPKKSATPPQDVEPLPPPSANAFRRGHKKTLSSLALDRSDSLMDGPKSAFTPRVGFPQTPNTGTFGPGQARAGEHPVRQPRGPPPLEELQASPTTKHDGSKNFATRQRRRALNTLVRSGLERRVVRTGSGSAGSMTPVSETEMSFPLSSDNDSDSVHSAGSGSLSGKPSIGSLRAAANGAIGSERKELKERSRDRTSVDGGYTANSVSSDEGASIGGGLVEIRVEEPKQMPGERRKMPMLVLTSAEKRKSSAY